MDIYFDTTIVSLKTLVVMRAAMSDELYLIGIFNFP